MFDISFSEVLVIAVVAMIVIGPQRLPKTVRMVGLLLGRAQRYVSGIKADIQREMELEELQKVQQSIQGIGKDIKQSMQAVVQETEKAAKQTEDSVRGVGAELSRIADDEPAAPAKDAEAKTEKAEDEKTQAKAATSTASAANTDTAPAAAAIAAAEIKAEPQTTVPAFLQGEVALSIPEASPASHQKPDA